MSGLFRWAGGKGRIVDALMSHIDIHRNCDLRFAPPCVGSHKAPRWIEPFVGGGAVALEAMRRGLAARYVLADGNADVMSVYATLLDKPTELLTVLRDFAESPEAEQRSFFNGLRVYHETTFEHIRAMRLLILQACGFNGLYRVNKSGVYNVPFSRKATFDFDVLREAAELLRRRNVVLVARNFAATIEQAGSGDIVYADPPYLGTHSAYTSKGFDTTEHRRLAQCLRDAASRGAVCWVSGSDCDETRAVYGGVAHVIQVSRSISCKGATRGTKTELLIRVGEHCD
jgi:DNA adenine methylase